jgi:anaerobic magnesium-protoporphyrin IX monomethyl ester cyclase
MPPPYLNVLPPIIFFSLENILLFLSVVAFKKEIAICKTRRHHFFRISLKTTKHIVIVAFSREEFDSMRILFLRVAEEWVQPGIIGNTPATSSLYPPLGLMYLAAVLEQNGVDVEIIDFGAEPLTRERLRRAVASADAIGMTVYTNNYQKIAEISREIKDLDRHLPQMIGGPHGIYLGKQALADIPTADVCCIGEGEPMITDVVQAFEGKKHFSEVHGIVYRKERSIKTGKPLQTVKDLDVLPFPARHLVETYTYQTIPGRLERRKRFTTMITSRGCPSHCLFCTRYGNMIEGYGFRQRSAENVVAELRGLDETYDSVMIVDDNFLADRKRAHRIFDLLIQGGTSLELMIMGARVDSFDRALYQKMRQAHVSFITYGIESGNQDVLDFYRKHITLEQARDTLRLARESGFMTAASFILGAPIETKGHIENTIRFACSLPLDIALFYVLHYGTGSELWSEAVKDKKISKHEYSVPVDTRRGLGVFTAEELQAYRRQALRRFYLRPSYIVSQLGRALVRGDLRVLSNGLRFITNL